MKNFLFVSNIVLFIAVVVLFVLFFQIKPAKNAVQLSLKGDTLSSQVLPIAYINVDSLLLKYRFAKDANESLIKKQEDSRLTINSRARELQNEMNEFQRKLENNAFLSRERAEQEHTRLLKKQQELQNLDGQLTQQLLQEQQKMSEELRDTINAFLKEYNKDGRYEIIFSNTTGDNILFASKSYDITDEVVKLLNERFSNKKK
ncbi:MAG: OmpH family outer membrane protein [Paludibacteraceae bacterium]|jgi:outer membrane protein|nr:OmpH family outer membrane protein [Paludibacteraceae bacterium]OPZ02782.1 MAG: Outer membrane protein (OmpH-like) [Bacteroidetes bacterium ADurb.BinA395]HOF99412.1 OmpH family outer membrane protein [Paludibacteraceae bacterium]HOR39485.1 OmpH family outer membrane protein [Paludibacteraceae bacterium]HPL77106.1 OmpH family outer membrane protein [Paludibacteraceae bacterium]